MNGATPLSIWGESAVWLPEIFGPGRSKSAVFVFLHQTKPVGLTSAAAFATLPSELLDRIGSFATFEQELSRVNRLVKFGMTHEQILEGIEVEGSIQNLVRARITSPRVYDDALSKIVKLLDKLSTDQLRELGAIVATRTR